MLFKLVLILFNVYHLVIYVISYLLNLYYNNYYDAIYIGYNEYKDDTYDFVGRILAALVRLELGIRYFSEPQVESLG